VVSRAWRGVAGFTSRNVSHQLGGARRARVVVILACVLGLSAADAATVGASATELRSGLHISNTDIGLLVAVTSLVAALATLPFGVLADRVRRTWVLGGVIVVWGGAMLWCAAVGDFGELLLARLLLGAVTAAAGPLVASLIGDYFLPSERGRIYGFILSGELIGAGFGFAVTGDIATLSWRAAFVILALPAFVLAWFVLQLPEPERGGRGVLFAEPGTRGADISPGDGEHEPSQTDAQRLAEERGIVPDPELTAHPNPQRMNLWDAVKHVLAVRTNVILIVSSACAYYFLGGVQTFGSQFTKQQYDINQAVANLLLLLVGLGAIGGVLLGGALGDRLLRRGYLNGRILVSAISAGLAVVVFAPALFSRSASHAVLWLLFAVLLLSAQNPPLDAARLDIMPSFLWGRAEAVRTFLRGIAQALAPLLFGAVSDHVFGGGRSGLQWTFVVMLLPLLASAYLLFRALRTYPRDVASAAALSEEPKRRWDWPEEQPQPAPE
jgi:MFS family permease